MSHLSASASSVIAPSVPFDPVRFCVMTTVALLSWLFGPPACVLLMSALGLWAYTRAIRQGMTQSRCLLKRPKLVLGYLGTAFVGSLTVLILDIVR